MAGGTAAGDRIVVEQSRRPGVDRVAVVTGVVTGNVIDRFTRCNGTIMAAETGSW